MTIKALLKQFRKEFYTALIINLGGRLDLWDALEAFIRKAYQVGQKKTARKIMDKYYYSDIEFNDKFWKSLNDFIKPPKPKRRAKLSHLNKLSGKGE